MRKIEVLLTIILIAALSSIAFGGQPVMKIRPEPAPPTIIYQPMVPPTPPAPVWPPLRATGTLTAFMTDYSATFTENGYPSFSFGDAFLWSGKAVFTEFSLGASIPGYLDGSFTWGFPVVRQGVGIPTVPLPIGGYVFGPRTVDTIRLTAELSGKNIFASTPYLFKTRVIMPAVMCEWWKLGFGVVGTPTTTSTSQAAVDVKQDFNKVLLGAGIAGDFDRLPLGFSYKALYLTGGGTQGIMAQADVNYRQKNLQIGAGYRYNLRKMSFGTSKIDFSANGPLIYFEGKFNLL